MADWPVTLQVRTHERSEFVDLTEQVRGVVSAAGLQRGVVTVFVPHTTAGVTINEHADPDVVKDMLRFFDELVPHKNNWRHGEGNSDSHIKTSMLGSSVRVLVQNGRLCLGTWQGIFFCEFDGPRRREVWVAVEGNTE